VLIKAEKGTARIQLLVARGPLDAKRVQWQKASSRKRSSYGRVLPSTCLRLPC